MQTKLAIVKGLVTVRRLISVMCAVAFLFVSLAHTAHHAGLDLSGSTTIELTDGLDGGAGDQSHDKADHGSGHCHGCVMLAIVDAATADTAVSAQPIANAAPQALAAFTIPKDVPYPIAIV
ncbi:MAG: hypothetical protein ACOY4O_16825 [Pseudomonadota bacterium]